MNLRKLTRLTLIWLLLGGSLLAHGWYAHHLRGGGYRREMQRDLSAFFQMPVTIERVVPLRLDRRAFEGVSVVLPETGRTVFRCRRAEWSETNGNGGPAFELVLRDGILELPGRMLSGADYGQLLRRGVEHDFTRLALRQVDLRGIDVIWQDEGFAIPVGGTHGRITFPDGGSGLAELTSRQLNGAATGGAIIVSARFDTREGLRLRDALVTIPPVRLADLGLAGLAGLPLDTGGFEGRLRIRGVAGRNDYELSGRADGLRLEEFTSGLPRGPIRGRLDLDVQRAAFAAGELEEALVSGSLDAVSLADVSRIAQLGHIEGECHVRIDKLLWSGHSIARLVGEAKVHGASAAQIARAAGYDGVSGRLVAEVGHLVWQDGGLASADVRIASVPDERVPQTIARPVIQKIVREILGFNLPRILPETIAYKQFGVRLEIRDNTMRVLGTHGPADEAILTVTVGGVDLPLVRAIDRPIALGPWIKVLRERWLDEWVGGLPVRVEHRASTDSP